MAKAYTPGLKVSRHTTHRVRRVLPIPGEVRVTEGDTVQAEQVVAETFMDGDVTPMNLANILSIPPGDVMDCLLIKEGEHVSEGDVIARTKGMFGMFKNEAKARADGTIENVSSATGQLMIRSQQIPVQVKSYMSGTVVERLEGEGVVIENHIAQVQGIFGIGGEAYGRLRMACDSIDQQLTEDRITDDMAGCVIIGGARVTAAAIRRAQSIGCSAVVSGGIDDQDLKNFLGYDLGVAITGSEKIGLTVIITEGFGDIAMADRTFNLLKSHEGNECSVNGATQIRAGVMRPEILVPLGEKAGPDDSAFSGSDGLLEIGTPVRLIRDPHFGLIGTVSDLPAEPAILGSGSKARVLSVQLEGGDSVIVPRANVELIEE